MVASAVLELVDAGIEVFDTKGALVEPSPGVALIEGSTITVGRTAVAKSRLVPRRVHRDFWRRIDTEPLGRPFPGWMRAADLVHAHLEALWAEIDRRPEAVVLAVPWVWSEQQLGLLLGIARSSGLRVTAMIDLAVAAAATVPAAARCFHLDLHLQRTVLTELRHGPEIARVGTDIEPQIGLVGLYDGWLRRVASLFVRETRFDPLHRAATEQALSDRLPTILEELVAGTSSQVSMTSGSRVHRLTLDRQELVATARGAYSRLGEWLDLKVAGGGATLLLSHRAAGLPGLAAHLAEIPGLEIRPLPQSAAAHTALSLTGLERVDDGRVPVIAALDAQTAAPVVSPRKTFALDPPSRSLGETARPTHLVVAGIAHAITQNGVMVGSAPSPEANFLQLDRSADGLEARHCQLRIDGDRMVVEDLSHGGTTLNGHSIKEPTPVRAGDRLRLGSPGVVVELVAMAG